MYDLLLFSHIFKGVVLIMSLIQLKSCVQFTRGTSLLWNALATPIPAGVLIFSLDDGAFKLGDGSSSYASLPTLFKYADLISAQGGVNGLFADPAIADSGKIVVVALDVGTGVMMYTVSNTTLASVLSSITALESNNDQQDLAIASLLAVALGIDVSINTAANDNLVTIINGRYSDSGLSISGVRNQIATLANFVPGSHLDDPIFYNDLGKTKVIDKLNLLDNTVYYVDVIGFNNKVATPVFGLTSPNTNITITKVVDSLFKVVLRNVTTMTATDKPVIFIASIDDGTGQATVKKSVTAKVLYSRTIVNIAGTAYTSEQLLASCIDANDNLFCANAGYNGKCVLEKFNSGLDSLMTTVYGGSTAGTSYADDSIIKYNGNGVAVDTNGNIYMVGGAHGLLDSTAFDMIIVKFDSNFNKLAAKEIGSTAGNADCLFDIVIAPNGFIYVAGQTYSENVGYSLAFIAKFDTNLNAISKFSDANRTTGVNSQFYRLVADSGSNIYALGWSNVETGNSWFDGIVVKFDSTLNVLAKKRFGGDTANDYFYAGAIDSNGNLFVVGTTSAEGGGISDALIVKFDSGLNVLAKKHYGGASSEVFYDVVVDSTGIVIAVGSTASEGLGNKDALIVRFSNNLATVLSSKRYGGSGDDEFYSVNVDSLNNIYAIGYTMSVDSLDLSGLVVRFPANFPSGSFTGSVITSMIMADTTTMTFADSTLTLNASSMTFGTSALTVSTENVMATSKVKNFTRVKEILH